jgi:hypothetical protein
MSLGRFVLRAKMHYRYSAVMARQGHLRFIAPSIELFSSSTWGRADQQAPTTQTSLGVLFCPQKAAPDGPFRARHGTLEPFTIYRPEHRVVLEQHLGEG